MKEEHIFAICAYKESAYLEACIQSLKRQTRKSKIILATSTPNTYIENLCSKYQIPMYVNHGEKGITQDWNFAYQCADSRYVTIAHQDDVYLPDYWEKVYNHIKRAKKPLIAFGDYGELRNKTVVTDNKLLKVKRTMQYAALLLHLTKRICLSRCSVQDSGVQRTGRPGNGCPEEKAVLSMYMMLLCIIEFMRNRKQASF